MRPIGFSTGALAKGDFERGLELQLEIPGISAVELSALRDHELEPLVDAVSRLPLSQFEYVSFHAPSKLVTLSERHVVDLLKSLPVEWPIIVHPEIIQDPASWSVLGSRLCVENMDNRKSTGRTPEELRAVFAVLPEATFCLDVGHVKQIDPTMSIAILMIREFGGRLRQVHVSDVGARGEHLPVSMMARIAFGRLAQHIPSDCPLIIESIIEGDDRVRGELRLVRSAFEEPISFEMLDRLAWPACQLA